MRTIQIAFALVVTIGLVFSAEPLAQLGQRASPHESTSATVNAADLKITYGRPYMRGRKIIGGLVPFDRIWTPGADEVTTLSTSLPIRLGDLQLKAGSYALWMLPTADAWTLIVNSDTGAFHTFHDGGKDIGRVALQKRSIDSPVEQLTFTIEPNPSGGGWIKMTWETTEVSAAFSVVQ